MLQSVTPIHSLLPQHTLLESMNLRKSQFLYVPNHVDLVVTDVI